MTSELIPEPLSSRSLHGRPAGVVTRTLAGAVDYALVITVIVLTYATIAVFRFLWNPVRFSWPDMPPIVLLLLGAVTMTGYLTLAWCTTGRTIGGILLHTRVVSSSRSRVRFVFAVVRAGFTVVFPIGLFLCAITPASRSVQDIVLRTRVLYDYPETSARKTSALSA